MRGQHRLRRVRYHHQIAASGAVERSRREREGFWLAARIAHSHSAFIIDLTKRRRGGSANKNIHHRYTGEGKACVCARLPLSPTRSDFDARTTRALSWCVLVNESCMRVHSQGQPEISSTDDPTDNLSPTCVIRIFF
jgi:hypothetical protein